jgi:predicted dehydrogenase
MLREQRLDAVDIMTPPSLHGQLCRLAADAGVAILCQKPLAPSWAEARAIQQDLGDRVRWMVHENWRFRPHYRQVHKWLQEGAIGRLRGGNLQVRSSGLLAGPDGVRPALARQPLLGRLPRLMLAEVLVHHLDVACWLAPVREVLRASISYAAASVPGETAAEVLLTDASGTMTFHISGDLADPSAPATLCDRLHLVGDTGEIRLDQSGLRLDSESACRSSAVDFESDYRGSYSGAISHFVDCLATGRPFESTPAWHVRILALVERAYALAGHEPRQG